MTDRTEYDERTGNSDRTEYGDRRDRLRPFPGVRISKGTDRARGLRALVAMIRRNRDGEDL